jgi:hypothetical protein
VRGSGREKERGRHRLPTSTDPILRAHPHPPVHQREGVVVLCSKWERPNAHTHTHTPHTNADRTIWIVKVHRWGIIQLGRVLFFPRPPRLASVLLYPTLLCSALLASAPSHSRASAFLRCLLTSPSPLQLVWLPRLIRGPTLKQSEGSWADSGRHLLSLTPGVISPGS